MYTEGRVQKKVDRRWGYLSSFAMGVFFSAGWIPCIGPVLSAIYAMAAMTATAGQGALLLLVYSLGLGIPFLITGAALSVVAPQLRRLNRHMGVGVEDHGRLPDPRRHRDVHGPAGLPVDLLLAAVRQRAGQRSRWAGVTSPA